MNDKRNALILFFKYPEMGRVKTRLAKTLGSRFVYDLYINLIRDILKTSVKVDADTIIAYSHSNIDIPENTMWNKNLFSFAQAGRDLGERMYNAFKKIFDMGFSRSIIVGSDIPDITEGLIDSAFIMLKSRDIVLGPSNDGGYYLIGTTSSGIRRSIFENIQWSTPVVLEKTIENIKSASLSFNLLKKLDDIDDYDDLIKFYNLHFNSRIISYTMNYLNKNKEAFYGIL